MHKVKSGLDKTVISNLIDLGGTEFLTDLANLYLKTSRNIVLEIHEAIKLNQAQQLKEKSHSLKSSSGNIGAIRLYEICNDLEKMGHSGDLHGASELAQALTTEFNQIQIELTDLIARKT